MTAFAERSLKPILHSRRIGFAMEAHNALSARLAEEAGFEAIWASGLSIATALGVRDSNEASWTQILDVLEFMADATTRPILADGDTGYGNFNNVRRLVRKLCDRGIAGVCIEDKVFPKTNSFRGSGQALATIPEFVGKIRAAKDSQTDPEFCLVARTEAMISGLGVAEALERAGRYSEAGADAIFVHSKQSTAREIEEFMAQWTGAAPVVIAPTLYASTPTESFQDMGVSLVIWANHSLRASIAGMRSALERIRVDRSVAGIEGSISSLGDVFALFDYEELETAELAYLPSERQDGIEDAGGNQP